MRKKLILCFTIILTAVFCLAGTPSMAAAAAKKPAAKPVAKPVAVPEIQTQYANVLIQLEIMPKPAKNTPKLSDKIKYEDFTLYSNNAMSVDTPKAPATAKNAKVKYISLSEADAILLKALGYGNEIEKSLEKAYAKAVELGLNAELNIKADKQLTRGEASVLIYNSLTVPFKETETAVNSYRRK